MKQHPDDERAASVEELAAGWSQAGEQQQPPNKEDSTVESNTNVGATHNPNNNPTETSSREALEEYTDLQCMEDSNDESLFIPPQKGQKRTPPKGIPGSLDSLVAKKYAGDFFGFFDAVLDEMRAPTFSFSGFTRRNGVPKARETLRNIAYYLKGEPTNQFLAETWKTRVHAYLNTQGRGERASNCTMSRPVVEAATSIVTPQQTRRDGSPTLLLDGNDICRSQKRARIRGREGALDQLVMDKFDGNFFLFLEFVEQEMQRPGFTPTHFVRQHRVPRGRETLRHIVSHLKQEYTSSDRLLAQMWKDRIRVYRQSKSAGTENKVTNDEPFEDSNTPEAINICSV